MARARSPKRDQAFQLWLDSNGKKLLKDIAAEIGVSEQQVRKWKNNDKWCNSNVTKSNSNVTIEKERYQTKKKKVVAEDVKQVINNPDLTDKQRLFCLHYVRCFNATKAYQKAYESNYETAASAGYRLLANVRVRDEIERLKRSRLNRELLDEHDIVQKYIDIAFADITDYVEFGREEVPVMALYGPVQITDPETGEKKELTKQVNTVRFKESTDVDGTIISEVKQGKDGASVKLNDRMKALDWLAAHMDLLTEEQKAKVNHMNANTERIRRNSYDDIDDGVEIINDAKTGQDQRYNHTEVSGDI